MGTLFQLMGEVVVKNKKANDALKETQKETQGLAKTMEKTSSTTGKSMQEIAAESGKTVNQLRGDVGRAAAEYQRQGLTASEAWKKAYADIGYAAKSTTENTEWFHQKSGNSMQKLRARVAELKSEKMSTSAAWKQATAEMKEATGGAEVGMTGSFARIAKAAAGLLASGAVIGFGKSCVEAAATVKANNAQFEAAFGELQGAAKEMFAGISKETGVLATRLQVVGTGAFSQFKGAGLDAAEALEKTSVYTNLAADAAAYYDMSLEEADSLMRSFIRGNTEAGDRIGLFTSETQRNEAALNKLGKKYIDCTEAEKQMIMLDIASGIYESSGAMGQASREADGYENVMGNLREAWKQFQAVVGAPILEKVIPILQKITTGFSDLSEKVKDVQGKIKDATEWMKEHETTVSVVAIAVGTLAGAIGAYSAAEAIRQIAVKAGVAADGTATVAMGLHTIATNIATAATAAFGSVMAFITSPITLVVLAIGALVAAGVALYKNWDVVKEKALELWSKTKEVFGNLKDSATEKFEEIKQAVSEKFNAAKEKAVEIFTNIKDAISEKVENIKTAISDKFNAAKDAVVNIFNSVKNALTTAWETIKDVVQLAVMFVVEIIKGAFALITLPWRFIWENCGDTITEIWNSIKSVVSKAINAVKTTITNVLNTVKSFITSVWNNIKSVTSSVWNGIKTVITNVWNAVKAKVTSIANAVKSTVTKVWNSIKSVTSSVWNSVKSFITSVWNAIKTKVTSVANSVKTAVTKVWNGIKSVTSSVFNAVKSTVTKVWSSIKSKITSVVNGIKTTVSNVWNGIKRATSNAFNNVKSTATRVWNNIKTAIEKPVNAAKNGVKKAVDQIKGFFDKLKLKLPDIKLPHFKLKGEFSLEKMTVPKLSVEWYKKAYAAPRLLNDATIFGYSAASGKLLGGGEGNGSEMVGGTNTIMDMIRAAVANNNEAIEYYLQRIYEILAQFFPEIVTELARPIGFDPNGMAKVLAVPMNKELGKISDRKDRGR